GAWGSGRVDQQQPTTELIEEDKKVELALLALGKLGSAQAIPYITTVLEKRPADYWVQTLACDTLAQFGDRAAIPVLIRSLEDPSFNALPAAFLALLGLG